jgi:hypothetical protein
VTTLALLLTMSDLLLSVIKVKQFKLQERHCVQNKLEVETGPGKLPAKMMILAPKSAICCKGCHVVQKSHVFTHFSSKIFLKIHHWQAWVHATAIFENDVQNGNAPHRKFKKIKKCDNGEVSSNCSIPLWKLLIQCLVIAWNT